MVIYLIFFLKWTWLNVSSKNKVEDLEYREERIESKQHQPIKKHIPLKLKSSNSQSSISVKLNSVLNKNSNTPKPVSSAPSIQQQTFDFNSDLIKTTIKEENKLANDLNTG